MIDDSINFEMKNVDYTKFDYAFG